MYIVPLKFNEKNGDTTGCFNRHLTILPH